MERPAGTYCLFDTAFGMVAIAWNGSGLTGLQLPEADVADTRARMERRGAIEGEPTPEVAAAIDRLRAYFDGEAVELDDLSVALPQETSPERRRIYDAARSLRWGETESYGALAKRAGMPGGARVVGQAMAANPLPIVIPCHRVLAAGDRLGGFSAWGGAVTKERLLVLERTRLALI